MWSFWFHWFSVLLHLRATQKLEGEDIFYFHSSISSLSARWCSSLKRFVKSDFLNVFFEGLWTKYFIQREREWEGKRVNNIIRTDGSLGLPTRSNHLSEEWSLKTLCPSFGLLNSFLFERYAYSWCSNYLSWVTTFFLSLSLSFASFWLSNFWSDLITNNRRQAL